MNIFLLLLAPAFVQSELKLWLGWLDWEDPSNWLDQLVPFSSSSEVLDIAFPSEMRHALGMPSRVNHEVGRLELTRDGVVALPEDARVTFEPRQGKRARYLRDRAYYWLDPDNWAGNNSAVPHLERLPCQTDLVILPPSSRVFSLRLPRSRVVEVAEVRLADDNESLASWEWRALGKEHPNTIEGGFTVKYSPFRYNNLEFRCQEGDLGDYLDEICGFERAKCGSLECEMPLQVEGHCCPYCGGRVRIQSALLSRVKRVARDVLGDVDWHARLTWDGKYIEVLVREKGRYEGVSTLLALKGLEDGLGERGVRVLATETSGNPMFEAGFWRQILAPLIMALALVIVALGLVCYGAGYSFSEVRSGCREVVVGVLAELKSHNREERNKKRFGFAKYENLSDGAESVHLGREEREEEEGGGERFVNPLYNSSTFFIRQRQDSNPQSVSLAALQKDIELYQIQ